MLGRSGVVFGVGTLEFRLLRRAFLSGEAVRIAQKRWLYERILDVSEIVSVPYTEPSARARYREAVEKSLDALLNHESPFASEAREDAAQQPKASDEDRQKYMALIGNKPFSSLRDIVETVQELNKKIAEATGKHP